MTFLGYVGGIIAFLGRCGKPVRAPCYNFLIFLQTERVLLFGCWRNMLNIEIVYCAV